MELFFGAITILPVYVPCNCSLSYGVPRLRCSAAGRAFAYSPPEAELPAQSLTRWDCNRILFSIIVSPAPRATVAFQLQCCFLLLFHPLRGLGLMDRSRFIFLPLLVLSSKREFIGIIFFRIPFGDSPTRLHGWLSCWWKHQQGRRMRICLAVFFLLVKTPTRAADGNLFGGIFLVGENTNKGGGREFVWRC